MIEPVQRERVEAALKSALVDRGVTASELGRQLGKGAHWVSSILHRIRDGQALTVESVRILRTQLPTLDTHLKAAGWWAGSSRSTGHSIPATRSTEHLRMQMHQLLLKREELDSEIIKLREQIETLEEIVTQQQASAL